jgi:PAS domain S-box-containing protein
MLGYEDGELIGKHSHACIHYKRTDGTPYPESECRTYASIREGTALHVEDECFCKKNGTLFPVEYTSTPILEDGQIAGAVVTFRDVTDRRRAEEALKLIQFSVDNASVSAFLIGPDARLQYVNEQACRTLDYTREELLSMAVYDLDPNFQASRWDEYWSELKEHGSLHFETQHRKKDGALVPVGISVNYVAFAGREYNWAFAHDISERKRTENELKHSYHLIKTIIDSMNDAISLIDTRDFTIISVNSAFVRAYGFSDESEIIGKHCYEVTHRRSDVCTAPDDICPLSETVRSGGHISVDHIHYGKRGEKIYAEVSTSPITDENGKVTQVVHVSRDITERKRAEQDRERLLADIARSNRELEQFAYVASHDLQEPLRMVASYIGLLERKYKGKLDKKADTYIHFAVDGALRMQKLIDGLLAYSRVASRGQPFLSVDLNRIYEDTVANLSAAITDSGARITKSDLPVLLADETQMLQLFQNLIGNAIKFARSGTPPEVRVAAGKQGKEWIFSVQDNGVGIEQKYFDQVFQIFRRLHSQQEYAGAGIGLAVCKKIVERHGGRIWVESKLGQGTTFFFTIPSMNSSGS